MTTTNTTFIIYDTSGNAVTAIQPNTYDGPGGVTQSSDLELYGLAYPNWGEGVDQNDYRLCENFACHSVAYYSNLTLYPNSRYNILGQSAAESTPAGYQELGYANGVPNGINYPITGQLWFNLDQQQLFVYTTSSAWQPLSQHPVATGTSPPSSNQYVGELWYNPGPPAQLEIWNGAAWVPVLSLSLYLPLTGGTMSGAINMSGNSLLNVPTPINAGDGVNKAYVDGQIASSISGINGFVSKTGDTMTGTLYMNNTGITITNGTLTLAGTSNLTINSTGTLSFGNQRLQNVGTPTASSDAATVGWATGLFFPKTGGTLGGSLNMNGNPLQGVPTPVNGTDGVNKAYVDNSVSNAISNTTGTGSLTSNGYWKLPGGFIVQWGSFTTGSYGVNQTIYFPIAFPHQCGSVTTSMPTNISYGYTSEVSSVSSSYFTFIPQGTQGYTIYWMAFGW